jgi:hypothetical protein
VREVVAATKVFPPAMDVPSGLARIAAADPTVDVRVSCLKSLVEESSATEITKDALETALGDKSDVVRVVAATALGSRGEQTLREIASREESEDRAAARAISVLGVRLSVAETLAILDAALPTHRSEAAVSAIGVLARHDDAHATARLRALLGGASTELAVAAADALGTNVSPQERDRSLPRDQGGCPVLSDARHHADRTRRFRSHARGVRCGRGRLHRQALSPAAAAGED